jgi:tRNA A-37 threonylcarbamoyl transferase component Bud32
MVKRVGCPALPVAARVNERLALGKSLVQELIGELVNRLHEDSYCQCALTIENMPLTRSGSHLWSWNTIFPLRS